MRIVTSLTILGLASLTLATGCGRFGSKKSTTPAPVAANDKKNEDAVGVEYASPEKTLVDQALQRAKANGKLLMIDVSAAWCAPCQLASKGMKTGSEKFNEVSKKYDFLILEETFFSTEDFLPFEVSAYPSFAVVDPATNKWSVMVGYENIDELASKLELFASKKSFLDDDLNKFREAIAQNKKPEMQVYSLASVIKAEKSTEEIKSLFAEIIKAFADKPEILIPDENSAWEASYAKGIMYQELIARGALTIDELKVQDADFMKSIADSIWELEGLAFVAPLKKIKLEKGTVAAAKACDALSEKVSAEYTFTPKAIPEGTTEEDVKKITESNEANAKYFEDSKVSRKATCLMQKVLTKLAKNDEVLAFVNSFKEEDIAADKSALGYTTLGNLLAFSGADFAKAADYVEKSTAASVARKEKYIAEDEKEVADLKAAGKTKEAESAEFWLEGTKLCVPALKESAEKRVAAYKAGLTHPSFLAK